MNPKIKKIFTSTRVVILLVILLLSVVAIYPRPFNEGVAIRSVIANGSANLGGIKSPSPASSPMSREKIIMMNNVAIKNVDDYYLLVNTLKPNMSVQVKTNKGFYKLITKEKIETRELNESEPQTITEIVQVNETIDNQTVVVNKTVEKIIQVPKTEIVSRQTDLGLSVYPAPTTNIRKGLDLQGGTRVLLQPEEKLSEYDLDTLIATMKERLNVYGLSDIIVRPAGDLSGNQYVLVEIAGATEEEIRDLLSKQGKFEAKIGKDTVFIGGKDITYVCRSADCAGIDPYQGCGKFNEGYSCRFRFSISLLQEAAQRQADLTKNLELIKEEGSRESYLSEKLTLFLDGKQVDELNIGSDLKGRAVTDIQISGSGYGLSQNEAMLDSLQNMKRLQTILITGSLPVKLNIVKLDTISPLVGGEFMNNAILIAVLGVIGVILIIYLRYREMRITLPLALNFVAEIIILLGVAALIGWNMDLAAIAGIIITVGTGIDNLIVITDETLRGERQQNFLIDWKKKIQGAFFIIMASCMTIVVAMLPLIWAGGGLLRGFAITTIIGVAIGILITRPVYAKFVEILLKD